MINYQFDKITFESTPAAVQTYTLSYAKGAGTPTIVTEDLQVERNGKVLDPPVISGLDQDALYTFTLISNEDTEMVFSFDVHTPLEFSIGPNPLTMKKLYAGQTVDIEDAGLLTSSLPTNYQNLYYWFESHYRDAYAGFANAIPVNGMKFTTAEDIPGDRRETGADFNENRYIELNNDHPNIESRVNTEVFNASDGSRAYSRFLVFYINAGSLDTRKYLYWAGTDTDHVCAYIDPNLHVTVQHAKEGTVRTSTSSGAVATRKWYSLEMRYSGTPNESYFFLWGDYHNVGFNNPSNIDRQPAGDPSIPVLIGTRDKVTTASGMLIKRFFNAPVYIDDNNTLYRLRSYRDYLPRLVFEEQDNPSTKYYVPSFWTLRLDDSGFSTSLPPDMPPGAFNMYMQTSQNERQRHPVTIVPFTVAQDPFELDFENDFDNARAGLADLFYGLRSQWGGANGGVNPDLIYANRQSRSLILEAHGDSYDGPTIGVERNTGNPATHNIIGDPRYGQYWKTRVGATMLTSSYLGYGETTVRWKLPVGIRGVAPAIWFFHYMEFYPSDSRFYYWQTRGLHPYGNDYLVVNNEIDMEQPSHIAQFEFATWAELAIAYFHPDSIDTATHIAVADDPDQSRNGLFRLVNVLSPNAFQSWSKISNTWQRINQPSFDHCKFNNWIGERGSGSGISYTQGDFDGEEYLAMLTDLEYDYADGQYHDWTIKWLPTHTELWIDGVKKRENKLFVPFNGMRLTIGLWFPSSPDTNEPWKYATARAWAGYPADFHALHLEISKISFTPYDDSTTGVPELHSETYPDAGLTTFNL